MIGYLANMNKGEITKIAIHDETGILKSDFKNDKETQYVDLSAMPLKLAKDTAAKNYEGLIYVPKVSNTEELSTKVEYISENSASINFIGQVEEKVDSVLYG